MYICPYPWPSPTVCFHHNLSLHDDDGQGRVK